MADLSGKTVVVTRAVSQANTLIQELALRGARVLHVPSIQLAAPDSWGDCDAAITRLNLYEWLVFTSSNGVRFFLQRLRKRGNEIENLSHAKIAAVGQATEDCLRQNGLEAALIPKKKFRAEGLITAFRNRHDLPGKRILILAPQTSHSNLAVQLRGLGAVVEVAAVYKNKSVQGRNASDFQALVDGRRIDLLTFTSPSTFKNFIALVGKENILKWHDRGCRVAAIGPVTAEAILKCRLPVDILPATSTTRGLLKGIDDYYHD